MLRIAVLVVFFGVACSMDSPTEAESGGSSGFAGDQGSGGTSGLAGDPGSGGYSGVLCIDQPCTDGFYCRDECVYRATSSSADKSANCRPVPSSCPESTAASRPICGCDGLVYAQECEARIAGTDYGPDCDDPNTWPEGRFLCWSLFCDTQTEYCERPQGDAADAELYEDCQALPTACIGMSDGVALCDCILDEAYDGGDSGNELRCMTSEQSGGAAAFVRFNLFP